MLEHKTLDSEIWKALSPSERLIYIGIKRNYNGHNNGEIPFKYAESALSSTTTHRALKGLEKKEWITKTKHGGLHRFYCLYGLTGKHDKIRK